ncbi:hypothetical protein ACFY1B_33785 [Streptomyces mirabilis]
MPGPDRVADRRGGRTTDGPIAEAFALDQQLSGARARRELGWTPPV